ncbi:hypothetical protein PBAL39_18644 [Pedobacter sp. BAL39]|uniref:RagB/SusD family nutrient uptake outer membrane protein n=1 Tax=Pedobacter sp. BAL39 TaxID=391596 RepID=UPI0001559719|nr:RagB/SusD family nutrient uptake outer membrane protein [Pedobacter sp. BAL39]EDM36921.1 hypothetical protein PBAL39_18644 [Pedobacter sp. BAL39]
MKKYSYIFLLLGSLSLTGISSCKDSFLEVDQKQRIVATRVADYELLMNSKDLYDFSSEGGWQSTVLLGDEVAAESDFLNSGTIQTQRLFRYEDVVYEEGQDSYDQKYFHNNLYNLNKIINEVGDATEGTEQQKQVLIAEARATRAWVYLQLINFYAKPYDASTAASDLGYPIIKTADISIRYFSRNTVQEVYDFILEDLNTALPALPVTPKAATRMGKAAAEAVLGKVYLYMGRFPEALTHFEASFAAIAQQNNPARLYNFNETFADDGSFLPIDEYAGPNGIGNNPNDYTESVLVRTHYVGSYQPIGNDGLVLTEATQALFGSTDLRLNFYTVNTPDLEPNPSGRLRRYSTTYNKFGVQLPDLYLMRAECRARQNNLTGAVEDLLTLRRNRMPEEDAAVPANVSNNQRDLLHFIMDERIREFASEGYRWFDMRRLHKDPLFSSVLPPHIEYDSNNNPTAYPLREERLTLRLPSFYIAANPGMPNNP